MKIAAIMQVQNYKPACRAYETLKQLTNLTIVLDDNSASPFPYRHDADVYIAQQRRTPWNCTANLTLLYYWAFVNGCDWVMRMDDDMFLSKDLQCYEDIKTLCTNAVTSQHDVISFPLFDCWERTNQIRTDGVWGEKRFPLLARNFFFDQRITMQDCRMFSLHQIIFPQHRAPLIKYLHGQPRVFHTGCMMRQDREARWNKYRLLDPQNIHQRDYSYMVDERGAVLEKA